MDDFLLAESISERRRTQAMVFHKKKEVQKYIGSSKTIDTKTSELVDNKQFALPF